MSTPKPHRRLTLTQSAHGTTPEGTPEPEVPATQVADGPTLNTVANVLRDPTLRRDAFLVVPLRDDTLIGNGRTEPMLPAIDGPGAFALPGAIQQAAPPTAANGGGPGKTLTFLGVGVAVLAAAAIGFFAASRAHTTPTASAQPKSSQPQVVAASYVQPDSKGVMVLYGAQAVLQGPTIHQGPEGVGYWGRHENTVSWTVSPPSPGTYAMSLDYACAPAGGGKFVVRVGEQKLEGESVSTGDWVTYHQLRLGEVTLNGPTRVVMQAVGDPASGLMNLRAVKLYPVTGARTPAERVAAR